MNVAQYYPEMAFKNSHNIQCVSEEAYEEMTAAVPQCVDLIDQCNKASQLQADFLCQHAYHFCESKVALPYFATGLNPYDIRLECGPHPLCYDFSNVHTFLNMDSTKKVSCKYYRMGLFIIYWRHVSCLCCRMSGLSDSK